MKSLLPSSVKLQEIPGEDEDLHYYKKEKVLKKLPDSAADTGMQ